jgi:hypothetical protein
MGSQNNAVLREQIESSIVSILDVSESWVHRFKRRQVQIKVAGAVLSTLLVWLLVAAGVIAYVWVNYPTQASRFGLLSFMTDHLQLDYAVLTAVFLGGVAIGVVSYMLIGRERDKSLSKLSSLLLVARKSENQNQGTSSATMDLLKVTDEIMSLLPSVVRKRNQDSLIIGLLVVVFLALPFTLPIALALGALVWLYLRHLTNKSYNDEMARFKTQMRLFEQRKNEFVLTL